METIKELIDLVYQFSRMYWKSISQQNLPVTTKYPEMVAEIFPHFEYGTLPPLWKENLWFYNKFKWYKHLLLFSVFNNPLLQINLFEFRHKGMHHKPGNNIG